MLERSIGLTIITAALITSVVVPELRDSYGAIVPSAINAIVLLTKDTDDNDDDTSKKRHQ
ncbi:hypothetical protein BV378_26590 [Nostoc sp. RF31YmG]|jgi:hypothetical protein|nr:hypothetical protein BV378_26590 [Nostoc sp. RF31YmG]